LSQEVATKKLALGLKERLETESLGGCETCTQIRHKKERERKKIVAKFQNQLHIRYQHFNEIVLGLDHYA
jgi:hypothetical protein